MQHRHKRNTDWDSHPDLGAGGGSGDDTTGEAILPALDLSSLCLGAGLSKEQLAELQREERSLL